MRRVVGLNRDLPLPLLIAHTYDRANKQAGQTKFKTAAVEYIRALGLKPTVIASSNHLGACVLIQENYAQKLLGSPPPVLPDRLAGQSQCRTLVDQQLANLWLLLLLLLLFLVDRAGNNDMLNLTSKKTLDAKMRVKSDIFAGWGEQIDHQVGRHVSAYLTTVSAEKGRHGAGRACCLPSVEATLTQRARNSLLTTTWLVACLCCRCA